MASTGVDVERRLSGNHPHGGGSEKKGIPDNNSPETASIKTLGTDNTHRTLKSRHIQLIGTSGLNSHWRLFTDSF